MGLIANLTEPQSRFLECTAKHQACVAGYASGKSYSLFVKAVYTLIKHKQDICVYEPTYNLLLTIALPEITKILSQVGLGYTVNKAEGVIRTNIGSIYLKSMTNYERLVGYNTLASFIDEMDLLSLETANKTYHRICARDRAKSNNPLYKDVDCNFHAIVSTPEGYGFLYHNFEKTPLTNSEMVRMSTYSNAHNLPPNFIESLEAQYPKNLLRAYLEGIFCNIEAFNVYNCFDRNLHVVKQTAPSKTETIFCGMDFNMTAGAAAFFVQRKNSAGEVVWLMIDEITQSRDTPDMISKIKERFVRNPIIIFPDATASRMQTASMSRSDHSMLRDAGFEIKVNSLNPRVKDRIICVNAALEKGKMFVSEGCKRAIDVLEQQPYDADGSPAKNGQEHLADGIGYIICHVCPIFTTEARYAYIKHL